MAEQVAKMQQLIEQRKKGQIELPLHYPSDKPITQNRKSQP
jgi:hypothetical protein